MSSNKHSFSLTLAASLVSLSLIVIILYTLQSVLVPLMFSILIAIILFPVARFLEKCRLGKAFAAMVSVIFAIALLSGLIWFIVHQVIVIGNDGLELQQKFTTITDTIQQWISQTFGIEPNRQMEELKKQATDMVGNVGYYLSMAFGSIGGTVAGFVLVPIFSFFLLYYRVFFREFFFKAFKNTPNKIVHETLNKIYSVVKSYLLGLLIVMAIVAILNSVGLMILGIKYAWFFGSIASLLMLLPYIGIAIGSLLPAVFALATKDNYWYALGVIIWFQVVQFLEGNVITPNIVGSKVSINPLMAMIAILLGGMLFGLSGLILALPITAVIKVILDTNPQTEAFGFMIGEPEKYHLKRFSIVNLKKRLLFNKDLDEKTDNHEHRI